MSLSLDAMRKVERHRFVPEELAPYAYRDHPLQIGHGQTISQPYIVALMTQSLALRPSDRVLEIGTGSGYQTAVLCEIAKHVYTIELVRPLGEAARERLTALGYSNVSFKIGDGYRGWPDHAPFDAIIVTAAPPEIPPELIEQLKEGGRIVVPVGVEQQELVVGFKKGGAPHQDTNSTRTIRPDASKQRVSCGPAAILAATTYRATADSPWLTVTTVWIPPRT